MEAVSIFPSTLPTLSLSSKMNVHNSSAEKKTIQLFQSRKSNKKQKGITVFASRQDHCDDPWGSSGHLLVDENMIVLRKRIHEMKIIERNYEPPTEWMEWEKQYYANYDEYICQLMGHIQTYLMNTRPSLAFGLLGIIAVSVPVSTVAIGSCFIEAAAKVLHSIHIG